MGYKNLGTNIRENVKRYQNKNAVYYKRSSEWHGVSWKDFGNQIEQISLALIHAGVEAQQNVAIFSRKLSIHFTLAAVTQLINVVFFPRCQV